jgi:hypothetical protein
MEVREAELLAVPYFHIVFTLPSRIGDIAYQNKAVIYDLLFKASAETMLAIAADPKHLGARIGFTSVLHTWGSAMTHHPQGLSVVLCKRPLRGLNCGGPPASAGLHRRTLGGQRRPGSKPCQGRQPPKAGAEGPPVCRTRPTAWG